MAAGVAAIAVMVALAVALMVAVGGFGGAVNPKAQARSASGAVISEDGIYRYALWRTLTGGLLADDDRRRTCLFVMLNPSTADADRDDPTIRRCMGFAKSWGYDALTVGNLYALRATKPAKLLGATDPIGPDNLVWLQRLAREADEVVCAWGVPPLDREGRHIARVLSILGPTRALGETKDGCPRHPLYVRGDVPLLDYPGGAE